MVKLRYYLLLLLIIPLVLLGCSTDQKGVEKTLSLSVIGQEKGYRVMNFQVTDKAFKESRQQGLYQVHLIDKAGAILRKISFEKMNLPSSLNSENEADFFLALPLMPKLHAVKLYKLDGSSGHYQLKSEKPLLSWTLPETVKKQREAAKK